MLTLWIGCFLVILFILLQEEIVWVYLKAKKVEFRRWRKDFKESVKWYGFFGAIFEQLPYHYKIQNFIWAIKHRTTHKFHIIKTGLKPGYYEIETLMVYGLFALLVRFVEKEYEGISGVEERIKDLEKWRDDPEELTIGEYDYDGEISQYKEVIRLYKWWKEVYPKYDENNPWDKYYDEHPKDFNITDRFVVHDVDEDGDPKTYTLLDHDTPEEKEAIRKVVEESVKYEKDIQEETTNNMISLIKIRNRLWS